MKSAIALATLLTVLAVGCGSTTVVEYEGPTSIYVPLPTPTPFPTLDPSEVVRGRLRETPISPDGAVSYQEAIILAEVVARVTLDTVTSRVETINPGAGDTYYSPALVFTFDVLEYLKGSGGDTLTSLAVGHDYYGEHTQAEAELQAVLDERDTRWDDREAIVFLHLDDTIPSLRATDTYFIGLRTYFYFGDGYSVTSEVAKNWLPAASGGGAAGASASSTPEQIAARRFLLDSPSSYDVSTSLPSGGAASDSTLSLGELKTEIAAITAEVAAGAGIDGYEECVEAKYMSARYLQHLRDTGADLLADDYLDSGQPAGTMVGEPDPHGLGLAPDKYGRHWTGGDDRDLFAIELGPPTLIWGHAAADEPADMIQFTRKLVTTKPLPAGDYTVYINIMTAERLPCDLSQDLEWDVTGTVAHVSAPDGTAAEALFDPVAFDGVSATSTVKAFVAAGSPFDTAIGPIKWKAGTLTVELTPAAAFAGHHLDFIAADGTLAHTAAVDDATRTGDTLSWAVADSPWEAGDKMMVRVYRKVASTCTVAEGDMKPGACYQDPVFTGAPFSFTVAEDIAVGSAVGTVSVSHPEMTTTTLAIISGDANGHFAISERGRHHDRASARL